MRLKYLENWAIENSPRIYYRFFLINDIVGPADYKVNFKGYFMMNCINISIPNATFSIGTASGIGEAIKVFKSQKI